MNFESSTSPNADLILIGGSVRSAAFSALRAGFQPICFDLFSDADLQANVDSHRYVSLVDDLIPFLEGVPPLPVVYAGGLENHPDLIAAIRRRQPIWGNDEITVSRVRDLESLQEAARISRISMPESRPEHDPPPVNEEWLIRPLNGCGGFGIHPWTEQRADSPTRNQPHLFQRHIPGASYSASFIASAEPGDVRFIGVTRQLIGEAACNARDFQWCGNIGPASLPIDVEILVRRFANVLKWKLGIVGVFGIDFVIDADETPWVVDVNPRYPASLELLEHAMGYNLLGDHCRCFVGADAPESLWNKARPSEFLGKAVLYANQSMILQSEIADPSSVPIYDFPAIADLPAPGAAIQAGDPVCTVYAAGESDQATWDLLQAKLREIDSQLEREAS